jgi:hypothetical protein
MRRSARSTAQSSGGPERPLVERLRGHVHHGRLSRGAGSVLLASSRIVGTGFSLGSTEIAPL